ncbi:MAG: rod shape-determining protein [Firmicutes bacterium]|nr:rod shape-determining protein [Bacillota bacterium]
MKTIDIAISLGSSFTTIFQSGYGVVLHEPTIVGVSDTKKQRIIGSEAFAMQGKTPKNITLITPIKNGIIIEPKIAASFLKDLIIKLYPKSFIFKPRIKAILAIPTGLKKEEVDVYYNVAYAAGISLVRVVPKIVMAAVGMDLPVASSVASMVAHLGGGTTEIATIALSGILSSGAYGVSMGGDMMDRAVVDFILGKHDLKIGISDARRLKEEIGSLHKGETAFREVMGLCLKEKRPSKEAIHAADIGGVLMPYYLRIADLIETAINGIGPEISSDILKSGIYLSGGSAKIAGIDRLLSQKLGLKVNILENPEFAIINGGGKLLKNKELLDSF